MPQRFSLAYGQKCAERLITRLQPHCKRVEVAGSIRRRRTDCGDVDLVVIPTMEPTHDLLGACTGAINRTALHIQTMCRQINGLMIKEGPNYIAFEAGGVRVDIWFANESNFGAVWLARTGSKEHNVWMSSGILKNGGRYSYQHGVRLYGAFHAETEESIYAALKVPFLPPEKRDGPFPRIP